MKIVVVGGSGRVGSKVVNDLCEAGHEAVPASRRTGIDVLTGAGLEAALEGAEVVIDAVNSPSYDGDAPIPFSRPPHATCSPLSPRPASPTMSASRSSAPSGCRTAPISGPRCPGEGFAGSCVLGSG